MSGKPKKKNIATAGNRVTKRDRKMTDKESSDLLESATQALAMIQGAKLIGERMSVRRRTKQEKT